MENTENTAPVSEELRKEIAIRLVKELRGKIDSYIRATQGIVFMCIPKFKLGMTKDEEQMYAHYRDNPQPEPSLELTQAECRLKEAKAYTGKLLGLLSGEGTPYKNDGLRKSVKDIEPEADKLEGIFEVCKVSGILGIHRVDSGMEISSMERVSPVMRIDYLRQEIAFLITTLKEVRLAGLKHMIVPGTEVETNQNGVHLAANALLPEYSEFSSILDIVNQKLTETRFYYGWALGDIRDMYNLEDTEVL